jgi:hypothetical protein
MSIKTELPNAKLTIEIIDSAEDGGIVPTDWFYDRYGTEIIRAIFHYARLGLKVCQHDDYEIKCSDCGATIITIRDMK